MALSLDARIAKIAAAQHGLITREQLLKLGMAASTIDRFLKLGRFERVHSGVYRVAGSIVTWHQQVHAAVFAAGPLSLASDLTATRLWKVLEFREAPIEVVVPARCNPREDGFIVHRSRRCPARQWEVEGVPVTSVPRTLVDLCRYLSEELVEEAFDTALRRNLLDKDDLDALSRHRVLGVFVAERRGERRPSGSQRETKLRRALRSAGLPQPVGQFTVYDSGAFVAHVDFAYPEQKIAIEYDGYDSHSSRQAFERDRRRWRALQVAGFVVVPYTKEDLRRPVRLTAEIYRLLVDRGHPAL
jgi:very-short-patch-repair endonuclease